MVCDANATTSTSPSAWRPASDTGAVPIDDRKRADQLCAVLADALDSEPGLLFVGEAMKAQKHDTVMDAPLTKDELARILVRGHHDSFIRRCHLKYLIIRDPGLQFRDVRDVMAHGSQCVNDRPFDTLVADELQEAYVGIG
jgi:hypothetical protein